MVPLTLQRRPRPQASGSDVSFTAFRAAVDGLPAPDGPLTDRLFALECLLRGGREARAAAYGLRAARSDADWFLSQVWEPDVPHVAALGQAISTINAASEDPPAAWPPLLEETAVQLASRPARFGLSSSPALLACVLRGLGAGGVAPPQPLLDAVSAHLDASPEPAVTAQLAEALARHPTAGDLAHQALRVAFTSPAPAYATAVARWWLAERWQILRGEPAPIDHKDLADARTQALCSSPTSDAPVPAMLAEVTARSISQLVVVPVAAFDQAREIVGARTIVENLVWRVLCTIGIAGAVFANLPMLLRWILPGQGVPAKEALQAAAAVITATVGLAIAMNVRHTFRRLGRPQPQHLELLTAIMAAAGTLLAVVLYK